MTRSRPGPDSDRLLEGRISSVAQRHANWGAMTDAQRATRAAELREIAGGRSDLLAEAAGLALGTAENRGQEYTARAEAVAKMCRLAGADETLIPGWITEGRRRAEAARHKPGTWRPAP